MSSKNELLTYSTEVAGCTEICWRCQVPSITELSTITVFTLFFIVQAKAITVSTCWAWLPIKTSSLRTVEPPWTDTISSGFVSCKLQRKAVKAIWTRITSVSSWRVGECPCWAWFGYCTANRAVKANRAFNWVRYRWASWTVWAIFTRIRVSCLTRCRTIKPCNKKVFIIHYLPVLQSNLTNLQKIQTFTHTCSTVDTVTETCAGIVRLESSYGTLCWLFILSSTVRSRVAGNFLWAGWTRWAVIAGVTWSDWRISPRLRTVETSCAVPAFTDNLVS